MSADPQEQRRDRLKLVDPSLDASPANAIKPAAAKAPPARKSGLKRAGLIVAAIGILGTGAWFGLDYWRNGRFIVSTDDAYVGADMATVSAKLSANIVAVNVAQNQQVKAGEALLTLDDGDWRLALDSARARTATAQATMARIGSQIEAGRASLLQAQAQQSSTEADVTRSLADYERASSLAAKSYGSQATLDAATAARDRAQAAFTSARAGVTAAEAQIRVLEAQRVEAQRQVDELKLAEAKVERDLSFTRVTAPIDGLVANTNMQLGDLVGAGKRLMSIVPLDKVYVDANFKETQIGPVHVGQRATITVDALPGEHFTGTVSGISGGTGSVFTLLPPDNATGNFTKIVQRVPVRIALDPASAARYLLRPGMSVVVSIDPRADHQG